MITIKEISKPRLKQFKSENYDDNLNNLDFDISMYPSGIFCDDKIIGICEFFDTSISSKVLHLDFIYLTSNYQSVEIVKSVINAILAKYPEFAITIHPRDKQEINIFTECGFVRDNVFYNHESNTMKHMPWYTNVRPEKLLIAL